MKTGGSRHLLTGLFLLPGLVSGCFPGPGLFTPIPMQPWVPDQIEERLKNQSDTRTPVLPPIPPGFRPLCEDPPDRATVLRAMPRVPRGIPYIYEENRDDIEIRVEKMVDRIDPPRFYPLIGPAQLHHCHWKCTVYYTETMESNYPFPFHVRRRRAEVVYIDRDHLHLCVTGADAQQSVYREMSAVQP
jgi:hypothetical protein